MKLLQAIRRPFRISLLTLLILVTIASVLMGMLSYELKRTRNAVSALRDTGLYVYYDYDRPGGAAIKPPPPTSNLQQWFRDLIGEDYFHPVVMIRGNGHSQTTTDSDLVHLSSLPDLEEIQFFRTPITDAGLQYVTDCQNLERISLVQVPITDDGLIHVSKLRSLRMLKLSCTEVTDDGLKFLGLLKNLNRLVLAHNQRINGEGFSYLRQLQGLRSLELVDLPLKDAALRHIEELAGLRRLILDRTLVTDSGVARLRAALPTCRIDYED